ncbi:hypothetical protein HIM_03942 [Hirsutella minnesotensis 3608]|uniref:Uncharacterized protein n=1 Tax=Hirsutella minnesotensis 3608 TaxID=1043627 RepID=A0A0F7ZLQ1_9HYPO|nr:hypothetical protein HIM_03942 [Hirsutella minnesotensis 3608]
MKSGLAPILALCLAGTSLAAPFRATDTQQSGASLVPLQELTRRKLDGVADFSKLLAMLTKNVAVGKKDHSTTVTERDEMPDLETTEAEQSADQPDESDLLGAKFVSDVLGEVGGIVTRTTDSPAEDLDKTAADSPAEELDSTATTEQEAELAKSLIASILKGLPLPGIGRRATRDAEDNSDAKDTKSTNEAMGRLAGKFVSGILTEMGEIVQRHFSAKKVAADDEADDSVMSGAFGTSPEKRGLGRGGSVTTHSSKEPSFLTDFLNDLLSNYDANEGESEAYGAKDKPYPAELSDAHDHLDSNEERAVSSDLANDAVLSSQKHRGGMSTRALMGSSNGVANRLQSQKFGPRFRAAQAPTARLRR